MPSGDIEEAAMSLDDLPDPLELSGGQDAPSQVLEEHRVRLAGCVAGGGGVSPARRPTPWR